MGSALLAAATDGLAVDYDCAHLWGVTGNHRAIRFSGARGWRRSGRHQVEHVTGGRIEESEMVTELGDS